MRRTVLALASWVALVAGALPSGAQTGGYPERPVRIIVPYAPGGGADIIARIVGEQLRKDTGQPFVAENKPGAFGIVAIEDLLRAKADGHTLMVGNNTTNTITPLLYPSKLSVDYSKAVAPVARIADLPAFLAITTTDFPPKTFAEFIDYAKKNPGKVRYGSAGVGSFPHYDAAIFAKRAGLDMIHVPNKDGAAGINKDLSTGDSQVSFTNVATSAGAIKAGLIRPLAVIFDKRLPEYPEVPTLAELGYPDVGTRGDPKRREHHDGGTSASGTRFRARGDARRRRRLCVRNGQAAAFRGRPRLQHDERLRGGRRSHDGGSHAHAGRHRGRNALPPQRAMDVRGGRRLGRRRRR
jgi:tripartite-type tricarboxylate transporter receptor subunit TctC